MKTASELEAERLANASGAPSLPTWARRLSSVLDSALEIPGTKLRIGLDPILGALLPELGDALTAVLSLTLLGVAYRERVPKLVLWRMLMNIALDALLGAIPLLGDVFDFAFKANQRNLELIERHRGNPALPATLGDKLVVLGVAAIALGLVLVPIVVMVVLVRALLAGSP